MFSRSKSSKLLRLQYFLNLNSLLIVIYEKFFVFNFICIPNQSFLMNRFSTLLLLPFLLLILMPVSSTAQERSSYSNEAYRQRMPALPTSMNRNTVQDTLLGTAFNSPCSSDLFLYSVIAPDWGYVSGNNSYLDREKAQLLNYTTTSPVTVEEVWGFFADAVAVGDGLVKFKLYDVAAGGSPGTLLGETSSSRVSGLNVSDSAVLVTVFPVTGNVTLTGKSSLFASLDVSSIYATNDTVALFTTEDLCGGPTNGFWELFSDNTWVDVSSASSFQLNLNLFVVAVISFDETASLDEQFTSGHLSISPAYPNPSQDKVAIPFELAAAQSVEIKVFDANARLIHQESKGYLSPGKHSEILHVNGWAAGVYTYMVEAGNHRLMSRFQVGQ